ncbi:MAG TPA: glycosyltransferase [Gemmatimonadaceae bacterium]|nr:glycosyltransferase [Gemmatimonadaceae bacterium]
MSDLRYRNIVPNRLNRPRDYADLVSLELDNHLNRVRAVQGRDLLLAQFALPNGPPVRASARRRGLPYAVYLRGDDVWIWPHTRRNGLQSFRETVLGASVVLSVSDALLTEARRLAEDDLPRGVVIANGIDVSLFRPASDEERADRRTPLGLPAEGPVVLCVAAALERKGWPELLAALARLAPSPPPLIAVTTGHGDLALRALRDRIAPRVTMVELRDLDAAKLSEVYRAADIFCLPSHGEGMSNAVLEALACGLPVITTPVGGHPEVIEPGVDGELVPVRDVGVLSEVLRNLVVDPARRARMGRAARSRAEAIGTSAENGGRVARLFDAVLEGAELPAFLMRSSYAPVTQN